MTAATYDIDWFLNGELRRNTGAASVLEAICNHCDADTWVIVSSKSILYYWLDEVSREGIRFGHERVNYDVANTCNACLAYDFYEHAFGVNIGKLDDTQHAALFDVLDIFIPQIEAWRVAHNLPQVTEGKCVAVCSPACINE